MKIGIFGGAITTGTLDAIVDEARTVEQDGFASYWAPQLFGHDTLTALAVVGREVPRIEIGTAVVPTYHDVGAAVPHGECRSEWPVVLGYWAEPQNCD